MAPPSGAFSCARFVVAASAFLWGGGAAAAGPALVIDVEEYRVEGVAGLSSAEVERAVYPYLGPARTAEDVEAARAALEKAYHDRGRKSVAVGIPPQRADSGVVVLKVEEGRVGRLRVRGSRYHEPEVIKARAPSLAEGTLPDFEAVQRDIVALQGSDITVTPQIRPGAEPGTLDVDLEVKDELPLHGSVEVNNRYNRNTYPVRLNAAVRYDNLWQLGHSVGFSFQTEMNPGVNAGGELMRDSRKNAGGAVIPGGTQVYSGYYLASGVGPDWLDLMVSGTRQESLNAGSGLNVVGSGVVAGLRAVARLPRRESWFHSLSVGFDYKRFRNDVTVGGASASAPAITYYPFAADYDGTLLWGDGSVTRFSPGVLWHFRGMGSGEDVFEANRAGSGGGFMSFRADLSHLQKLPGDAEWFGGLRAQGTTTPLVANEQFGIGGLTTVRGYLESEAMGDSGLALSSEVRSPSFTLGGALDEWRLHLFADWAGVLVKDALPGQDSRRELLSVGAGTRMKFAGCLSAAADVGVPLLDGPVTRAGDVRVTLSLRAEF